MTARWDRLPPNARVAEAQPKAKRARGAGQSNHGTWRCAGSRGCGEVVTGVFAKMERHLDGHGGGRADAVFTTTTRGGRKR